MASEIFSTAKENDRRYREKKKEPEILKSEVVLAIAKLNRNKGARPNGINRNAGSLR